MLMSADNSCLLVVDVQERLLTHINGWQGLLENILWLVRLARKLGVPSVATEQYPRGLGHTVDVLVAELPESSAVDKVHFSCVAAGCLAGLAATERQQMVVCGIESHVCVMQTALDLRTQGKDVFVVANAVGSRDPESKALALARMRSEGIVIVDREMVAFEWLRKAGTPTFKEVSKEFLR